MGLVKDFEKAKAGWSEIREVEKALSPLLTTDDYLFRQRWTKRNTSQTCALQRLEKYAGLDGKALRAWAAAEFRLRSPIRESTATAWLGRHPILTASAAVALIFVVSAGWADPLAFVDIIAVMAFVEMSILWSELTRVREHLDELQNETEAANERNAETIAGLWLRVRKISNRSSARPDWSETA